jgi:integrase
MSSSKLTKRVVECIDPADRDVIHWDSQVKGFGVKVTPRGRRSYFLYYRTRNGTQRRPSIGVHGDITAEQARDIAKRWLAVVAEGGDPSRDRQRFRSAPTVSDLCRRFMAEHSNVKNKNGTAYNYQRLIDRFIVSTIGNRRVHDIDRVDIHRLHHNLNSTPYQANRLLGLLSKIFNMAERWDMRPDGSNPTRHVEKFKEHNRQRYLLPEELSRLSNVLNDADRTAMEMPSAVNAIRLLIFTGCRMSEILTLKWEWVNFDRRCLELPDSKTDAKTVFLNAPALDLLRSMHDDANAGTEFVIPGRKPGRHLVNLEKPWRRIRSRANLENVRLHDLRHTYASIAAGLGEGLHLIGKLLGHSQASTSHRYAHLADSPVQLASDRIGQEIAKNFSK